METLITTLGWVLLVLIVISAAIVLWGYIDQFIDNVKENRKEKIVSEVYKQIIYKLRSSGDWLSSPVRRPFQLVFDKLARMMEFGRHISPSELMDYIDRVIDVEMDIQKYIDIKDSKGSISDGYHTFDELYQFRMLYNAALFNQWGKINIEDTTNGPAEIIGRIVPGAVKYEVHKSRRHHDGELCFGGGWFIVVAILPTGQISNHYEERYWDLFQIPETEKARYEFDGHTSEDVVNRLMDLCQPKD